MWDEWIRGYLTRLRAARMSPGTVRLRRHYLRSLAARYPHGPALSLDELTEFVATPAWSAEAAKSARSSVRGLYGWAVLTGRLEQDPSADLPAVAVPAAFACPVADAAFRCALLAADPRTELMLRLAGEMGLRRAEIAALHADDVDGDVLQVRGKGGRLRVVPLTPGVASRLQACGGFVFPGQVDGHLSADWVGRVVKTALAGAGTAHGLRRRFARAAYAPQRDLLAVQSLLGHSRPETTRRYTGVDTAALRAAVLGAAA